MTLLERYIAGEYKEVWAEMVAGIDRYGRPIKEEDAEAVADETMRRVRVNIETLVARLTATGYEFGVYPDGEPISDPAPAIGDAVGADEKTRTVMGIAGVMPLSVRAFYRHVGSVCLAGRYPDTQKWYPADPLWVDPLEPEYARQAFAEWQSELEEYGEGEREYFHLELAPDDLHKSNVSGGPPYAIELPCAAADAIVIQEWHNTTFVDYLRICFAWGGFPGFARKWDGENWIPKNAMKWVPEQIVALREGLLPI